MSYNVDSARIISGSLTISRIGREWLERDEFPRSPKEDSVLPESYPRCGEEDNDGYAPITNMWWSGEASGKAVECGAFEKFLSFTKGTADIILTWEGGDSFSGYRVVDGQVTEHLVEMVLGEQVAR